MMRFMRLIPVSLVCAAMIVPASHALTASEVKQCKAMGQSLQVRSAELQEQDQTRVTEAEAVETAGALWEDAEVHRYASPGHAAEADALKADFDALKSSFMKKEMTFFSNAAMLNEDMAAYNAMCAAKN